MIVHHAKPPVVVPPARGHPSLVRRKSSGLGPGHEQSCVLLWGAPGRLATVHESKCLSGCPKPIEQGGVCLCDRRGRRRRRQKRRTFTALLPRARERRKIVGAVYGRRCQTAGGAP